MHVCGTINISVFENNFSEEGGGIDWKEKEMNMIWGKKKKNKLGGFNKVGFWSVLV